MSLLAIETSTPQGSLALWDIDSAEVGAQETFVSERAHNARVFEPLERLLAPDQSPITVVCVGTGPGSYSGVRVGIAVANGLSLALKVPVFGLPSWLALPVEAQDYLVVGDARRGSFFLGTIRSKRLAVDPEVLDEDAFRTRLEKEGGLVYSTDPQPPLDLEDIVLIKPHAADLARVSAGHASSEWEALARQPLQPFYLREAYITTPTRRSTTVQESSSSS